MTVEQELMERRNSPTFCWRSNNKGSFSTDMFGCVLQSVRQNFAMLFLTKPPADRREPPVVPGP